MAKRGGADRSRPGSWPPGRDAIRWAFALKDPWQSLDCKGFSRLTLSKPVTFEYRRVWAAASSRA
jgi:hypothetical protein